ncbi:MAG: NAD(P)-dependent alcohol dehydrogenase [Hyphomicrobiales bacterium]|nr:MAG: NAD(P)-dependent alcohol dehydrogenase [Hyphomicrobiales bacterium]
MKAVTYRAYGGPEVLNLVDLPKPSPASGQLLVRVRATSVTSGDARMRAFNIPGPFKLPARFMLGYPAPKNPILGYEFAGEVEAVGEGVSRFKPGDRVYGGTFGAYAEYLTIAETGPIAPMEKSLSFEEAASIGFGTTTAMHFLNSGKVGPGTSILIIGASGCVGVYSIQLAKHLGATVTAVCSGRNAELVRSLGADRVIDYTNEDYAGSGPYDVVMDAVGATSFNKVRLLLKRGGVFLNVVMNTPDLLAILSPFKDGRRIVSGSFDTTQAMLLTINDLVAADAIAPVIDRTYALEQIREAHAYVDTKRKRGAVVVTI